MQIMIDEVLAENSIMMQSMQFKYDCDKSITMYRELYKDYFRRVK